MNLKVLWPCWSSVAVREQQKWAAMWGKVTWEPQVAARQAGVATSYARSTIPQYAKKRSTVDPVILTRVRQHWLITGQVRRNKAGVRVKQEVKLARQGKILMANSQVEAYLQHSYRTGVTLNSVPEARGGDLGHSSLQLFSPSLPVFTEI